MPHFDFSRLLIQRLREVFINWQRISSAHSRCAYVESLLPPGEPPDGERIPAIRRDHRAPQMSAHETVRMCSSMIAS